MLTFFFRNADFQLLDCDLCCLFRLWELLDVRFHAFDLEGLVGSINMVLFGSELALVFLKLFQELFADLEDMLLFVETFNHLFADCTLMVTKDGNLPVCFFIFFMLFFQRKST